MLQVAFPNGSSTTASGYAHHPRNMCWMHSIHNPSDYWASSTRLLNRDARVPSDDGPSLRQNCFEHSAWQLLHTQRTSVLRSVETAAVIAVVARTGAPSLDAARVVSPISRPPKFCRRLEWPRCQVDIEFPIPNPCVDSFRGEWLSQIWTAK